MAKIQYQFLKRLSLRCGHSFSRSKSNIFCNITKLRSTQHIKTYLHIPKYSQTYSNIHKNICVVKLHADPPSIYIRLIVLYMHSISQPFIVRKFVPHSFSLLQRVEALWALPKGGVRGAHQGEGILSQTRYSNTQPLYILTLID